MTQFLLKSQENTEIFIIKRYFIIQNERAQKFYGSFFIFLSEAPGKK